MKIVAVDNYNRENISDILVAENVQPFYAGLIVGLLNKWAGESSERYYKPVADDYKLFVFEP